MALETTRLFLRPWRDDDAEDLFLYARNPAVGPTAGWPVHTSVENSRAIIRGILSVPETYAICRKEDGRPIGCISILIGNGSDICLPDNEGEVGFWIGVPFWNQGFATEALREAIRHSFEDLRLNALWCGYFDGNERSRRVQDKCGFLFHHTVKDVPWKITGDVRTEHITRLSKEYWKK